MKLTRRSRRRATRRFVEGILLACGLSLVGVVLLLIGNLMMHGGDGLTPKSWRQGTSLVHQTFRDARSAVGRVNALARLRRLAAEERLPRVQIDLKFRHLEKLRRKRREALKRGVLLTREDDFVPAELIAEGRRVEVRLRLKGDRTDHLQGGKWSFRVHVKGDDALFGMRRFSLQAPETRAYHLEPLLLEHLRREGILVPRYFFVDVVMNGERRGIMAVEEAPSKELLEAQGRRESVILAADESYLWEQIALNENENGFRPNVVGGGTQFESGNLPFKIFQARKAFRNPQLSRFARQALGMMRGYVEGGLPAEAVFDLDRFARFTAVATLWQAAHGQSITNRRFYYNPLTRLFEPIAFDNLPFVEHGEGGLEAAARESEDLQLFASPRFREAVTQHLHRVSADVLSGETATWLAPQERRLLHQVQVDYPWRRESVVQRLRARAERLVDYAFVFRQERGPIQAEAVELEPTARHHTVVLAYLVLDETRPYLEFQNLTRHALEVTRASGPGFDALAGTPGLAIPPGSRDADGRVRHALAGRAVSGRDRFELEVRLGGQASAFQTDAIPTFPRFDSVPYAAPPDLTGVSSVLPVEEADGAARLPAGDWTIPGDLVFPAGTTVVIPASTRLAFAPGARMVVRGALESRGRPGAPVVLEGAREGEGWGGLIVLQGADDTSRVTGTRIRNTAPAQDDAWGLTGGVTFHGGAVSLEDVTVSGSRFEDGMNLVNARFDLKRVTLSDTRSDALDVDFGRGVIVDSRFVSIGGDALDVSGTTAEVARTRIDGVRDKAISVGEGSDFRGREITARASGTAVACKDGSQCRIEDSRLLDVVHAPLMSYRKKSEYPAPRLVARNVALDAQEGCCVVQRGSQLELDGRVYEGQDLDVEALYREGYMRR